MRHLVPSSLLLLVLCFIASPSPAGAQTRLFVCEYEFNNPKLKGMDLDGSNVAELFAPPPSEWLLVGLDHHEAADRLYWLHGSTPGTIRRAALDGSSLELLLGGLKIPRGLAIDRAREKIYWSAAPPSGNALGLVQRANLDGSGLENFYEVDPYDPVLSFVGSPTVDPTNGYVYFCTENEIRRKRTDGTGQVETLVRGVTTVRGIDLDVENQQVYFLDANTNSDYLGRCGFDDTGFTVLVDSSPGQNVSSGLFDLVLDLGGGKAYWTDEMARQIRRSNLDGSGVESIYDSPVGLRPIGLAFDVDIFPPISDCNGNGIPDRQDIDDGRSDDCNGNGVPDECEQDPCAVEDFLIDHGSDPESSGRALGGDPAPGYEIFQPFDVISEVALARIDLDGWTVNHHPDGFTATLFPDDGTGTFPDEMLPIESADFGWRFSGSSVVWVGRPYQATLAPGRYWIRLTANDAEYDGVAHVGVTGLPSKSRRNGQVIPASRSIALRVLTAGSTSVHARGSAPGAPIVRATPNPFHHRSSIRFETQASVADARVTVSDASGRPVKTLHEGRLAAGAHDLDWDGRDEQGGRLPSGVYFYTVEYGTGADTQRLTGRLILVR
jgi:hypothetical protein